MDAREVAAQWTGFYHTAFHAAGRIVASGRELKIGYRAYDDLHQYADDVASAAVKAVVDIVQEVRGAPPVAEAPAASPPVPYDDIPF